MRLRTQLALAFFLLAVVPLLGVTLYSWQGSQRAFRQAVAAEAGDFAAEMSTRVDVVADELKARLERMKGRPQGRAGEPLREGPARGARGRRGRRAAAAAAGDPLRGRAAAGRDPVRARRRRPALRARSRRTRRCSRASASCPGTPATRRDAGDWVVAERPDPDTGIVIAVARPIGPGAHGDPRARPRATSRSASGSRFSRSSASCRCRGA